MPTAFGIVVRADGTVPFDLVAGEEHPHKAAILAELGRLGHDLAHSDRCSHHKGHACSCHPRIKGWKPNASAITSQL